MKRMKQTMAIIVLVGICICLSTTVNAHKLWLNATDYYPEIFSHPKYAPQPRAKTVIYFGWGHKLPVSDLFSDDYLDTLLMVDPTGNKTELEPGKGGFMATELLMKNEGGRVIAASVKPGFHGDVKGKKNFYEMRYEMYAKALIAVGSSNHDVFLKPIGQRFEIVPLQDPKDLKPGDWLTFNVLLDGKPARGVEISASPYAKPLLTVVDNLTYKETGKIKLMDCSGPWIVTAKLELPATAEFKDKCSKLYFISTLTFEVP
ncbi:hypothetical protein DSCO28_25000 [Desulfosarcina ovata subsp. sediminis]|uniref:DUF4198 domain-containing protein n=1 Tax=Desulfosarcina ovata subsp. sediminis TaxID=885957 RepID=A0A5K7ZKN8_9BACT|nr:DUF4198 domain-containing protein [Desulfosarcina ovata]BBO81934.1 hypothetical protein DSCO28_25000 [Desulfosarcina ovata subsp. sediminis]